MNIRSFQRNTILLVAVFVLLPSMVMAHPWKPNEYIIIDTDGGIDDFRTINLLLSSPAVRVLGISCSNGVISAEETYKKLNGLLKSGHHEGILTAVNSSSKSISRECRPALKFEWGLSTDSIKTPLTHIGLIDYIFTHTKEKITFLNLGSLRTLVSCNNNVPEFKSHLKDILWMADYPDVRHCFNYASDTAAYDEVLSSDLPLKIINGSKNIPGYGPDYVDSLKLTGSYPALKTALSFSEVKSDFRMKMYDEIGALYLHYPNLFSTDSIAPTFSCSSVSPGISTNEVTHALLNIIRGQTINQNQVLLAFPNDSSAYISDIQPIVNNTTYNFGMDEWVACAMTMELHRHVGIYALIGAKMGIRAREYFGTGVDEMFVTSFAGSTPPFSCMNDGLQVSTGATLGHGLIRLAANDDVAPKAEFEYLGQKISISLKNSYKNQIKQEIKEASMLYGLNSNSYWELVRLRTLYYWSHWDRNEIFDIKVLK
jgi:inosine-uridine nucleoside N-ribohydrolase